jgi:hypothetical protein
MAKARSGSPGSALPGPDARHHHPPPTPHVCLRCRATFLSRGLDNRICGPCCRSDDWRLPASFIGVGF